MKEKPLVSVIITTKNSARTLKALLNSLTEQSYKNLEVILVDNNSTDATPKIAKRFTKKVFNIGPERSTQRNYGASKASGSLLLFLDSDMVLSKAVISDCVQKIISNSSIGGLIIPEKSFGKGLWAEAKILERNINAGAVYFEAARFFPKKVFQQVGGYDPNLTGPEDWDLPQNISKHYKIERISSLIYHNEGSLTLSDLFKKKYYYGLSAHKYLTKHNLPVLSPKTVYFLRPAFYRNWRLLIKNPSLTLAMIWMLLTETVAGGMGYFYGRIKSEA